MNGPYPTRVVLSTPCLWSALQTWSVLPFTPTLAVRVHTPYAMLPGSVPDRTIVSTRVGLITVLPDTRGDIGDNVPDATAVHRNSASAAFIGVFIDFQNTFNRRQSRRVEAIRREKNTHTHTEYLTRPGRGEVPVNQCVHACTQIVHSSFPTAARNPHDVTVLSADECE